MIIQKIAISKIKPAAYNPRKDLKPGDPEDIKGIYGDVECGDAPEPELINGKETG